MKDDTLVKYISDSNNLRIIAIDASITVDDARIRHRLFPIPAIALGRLLISGILTASTMKEGAMVSLKVQGDGPLGFITVDATYDGHARGYCQNPHFDVENVQNSKISPYIGNGQLKVVKRIDHETDPYTGIVNLYTGEIGEDIAYYFLSSEQIPTAISLGVYYGKDGRVAAAGGILVQALPPQKEEFLAKLETIFAKSPSITDLVLNGADADGIVQAYLPGFDLKRLEAKVPMFKCFCQRSRSEKAIISLGKEQLQTIKEEDGEIDITCDYCGQHYFFSEDDLQKLLDEM
ncbi:Hsp33 family molecular chaperone HslO [Candidatus Uabimicrobium amorphum]|uniref:33 kDa chaperonin n=1 Tax=Uabimicrobium amorphum TaxID=2596890 RepID=A0A5S9IKL0_UABAM|nr:Hsp33 family molecular chaperone HslO [Candidatus Uabimicrobium amorphum]BBM83599.1 33 kDa chaperonin [Candidatus Uabimicrobium amorphum]